VNSAVTAVILKIIWAIISDSVGVTTYITANEITSFVHHSPGGDTNADDVVAGLCERVPQRLPHVEHHPWMASYNLH